MVTRKFLDITNGNQSERLLMSWEELMLLTLYSCVRLHCIGENSVLCRLFYVFLNGSNLYDDCMLAVLHDKAVKDIFNSFVRLCINCLFLKLCVMLCCLIVCILAQGLSVCLTV